MSSETSRKLGATVRKERKADPVRIAFLRLFGDVTRELNKSVKYRIDSGETQAALARAVDQDPAFLSRILSGASGTNLRSVAAVLAATKFRLHVTAIPLEKLAERASEKATRSLASSEGVCIQMMETSVRMWSAMDLRDLSEVSPEEGWVNAESITIKPRVKVSPIEAEA